MHGATRESGALPDPAWWARGPFSGGAAPGLGVDTEYYTIQVQRDHHILLEKWIHTA